MTSLSEPARSLPVAATVDLCVVGGSCTGVFAAVRAARLGASVALVEKHNCFGGVATAGLVNIWHSLRNTTGQRPIIAGLTREVIERLKKRGAVQESDDLVDSFRLNTEELKIELDELVTEHRILPFLQTYFAAPLLEGNRIKAVAIENVDGRQAIVARQFIDATGDGSLAIRAGVPTRPATSFQPPTTCAKFLGLRSLGDFDWQGAVREHGAEFGLERDWGWGSEIPGAPDLELRADTHVFGINTAAGNALTRAEIEGRRQIRAILDVIRKYGPPGSSVSLADLAATIGARETPRLVARYQVTGDEVLRGNAFPDAIANGSYRVDVHHSNGPGLTFRYLDGTEVVIAERGQPARVGRWRPESRENPTYYQIPLRSLTPATLENLMLAGRLLDTDAVAFSAIRVMVNMNQTGEASGVASIQALTDRIPVQQLDAARVRDTLARGGSLIL